MLDFKHTLQNNKALTKRKKKNLKNNRIARIAKLCFKAFDGSSKSEEENYEGSHISIWSLEGGYKKLDTEIRNKNKMKSRKSPKTKDIDNQIGKKNS